MTQLNYRRGINTACAMADMTILELAEKTGIKQGTLYTYTKEDINKQKKMTLVTAIKIAEATGITLQEFVNLTRGS